VAKKTLNIVESAYRAVMEEQDDTILWLLAAMQGAGAEHTVVLRGNAVNYAVAGQGVPGLKVGEWKQTQAPKMDRDVLDLIEKRKIPVYVVAEDLADRADLSIRRIERDHERRGNRAFPIRVQRPAIEPLSFVGLIALTSCEFLPQARRLIRPHRRSPDLLDQQTREVQSLIANHVRSEPHPCTAGQKAIVGILLQQLRRDLG